MTMRRRVNQISFEFISRSFILQDVQDLRKKLVMHYEVNRNTVQALCRVIWKRSKVNRSTNKDEVATIRRERHYNRTEQERVKLLHIYNWAEETKGSEEQTPHFLGLDTILLMAVVSYAHY